MENGRGVGDSHGGGCGAQEGGVTGWALACRVIEGNGAEPVGLFIPLLKGTNEAPIGSANGWVESESDKTVCALREVVSSGAVVAAVAGVEPGLSNCMN